MREHRHGLRQLFAESCANSMTLQHFLTKKKLQIKDVNMWVDLPCVMDHQQRQKKKKNPKTNSGKNRTKAQSRGREIGEGKTNVGSFFLGEGLKCYKKDEHFRIVSFSSGFPHVTGSTHRQRIKLV